MPTQLGDGAGGRLPPFAVSACTTYHSSFAEDLANYRALDIDGIGLWEYKLPEGRDDETLARFQDSGLTATFCFPNVPGIIYGDVLFSEPKDPRERLALLKSGIRRLARFRPLAVACLVGFITFLVLCLTGENIEQPGKGLVWAMLGITAWEAYGR